MTSVLDRLQAVGEAVVVNPQKRAWVVPGTAPGAVRIFGWTLLGLVVLTAFAMWFTGGQPAFIYEAF